MARTKEQRIEFPFAIGDLYLAALPELREVEIEDVVPAAQAIKIRGEGWVDSAELLGAVRTKLGRVKYSASLLGVKRKLIREAS